MSAPALAATARRALACDAVVLLDVRDPQLDAVAVAHAGVATADAARLTAALAAVPAALDADGALTVEALPASTLPGRDALRALGFAALDAMADAAAPGCVLVALWGELGEVLSRPLARELARQGLLRLQASELRGAAPVPPGLDELVLLAGSSAELVRAMTELVARPLGARALGVMVLDERRDVLQMLPGSFARADAAGVDAEVSRLDLRTTSGRVLATGCGTIAGLATTPPELLDPYVVAVGLPEVLSVPLTVAGRRVGVLHLADRPEGFTAATLARVERLAPRVAAVVELSAMLGRLRRQARLEEVLSEAAVDVAAGIPAGEQLLELLEQLRDAVDAGMVAFVGGDEALVARIDELDAQLEEELLTEARDVPGIRAYVVPPSPEAGAGWSVFHAPVRLGRQSVGTLVAQRGRADSFSRDERDALHRVAHLIALSHATERYQRQRVVLARMHERQRIAEDLHDDVAQLLFAAQMSIDGVLEREPADRSAAAALGRARGLLVRGDTTIRTMIDRLSATAPTDLGGRLASLIFALERERRQPIGMRMQEDAVEAARRLRRATADMLVEVARAALVEAARVGRVHRLTVSLELPEVDRLVLAIVEDVLGDEVVAPVSPTWLRALREALVEQGGDLVVARSEHAGGLRVTATTPV